MRKLITWNTPKEYQERRTLKDYLIDEATPPPGLSMKKKPPKAKVCRKLKGPHIFGEWKPFFFGWEKDKSKPKGWFVRFCTGCNRKDTWVAPTLPGPYWKLDLDARPPGYKE